MGGVCGASRGDASAAEGKAGDVTYAHSGAAEPLVAAVQRYFFEEGSFAEAVERWTREHVDEAGDVPEVPRGDEGYSLRHTELHASFLAMLQAQLTRFLAGKGASPADFYRALKRARRERPRSLDARFVQLVLAATDFNAFIELLRDAQGRRAREAKPHK